MSKDKALTEYKMRGELVSVSKSGQTAWHSYTYKKEQLAELVEDYERQYNITVAKNHLNIVEQLDTGIITGYLRSAGLNAIANSNKISTTIEVLKRTFSKPYFVEVKATAILPEGTTHEFVGSCLASGRQGWFSYNQTLAFAQTKARGGAIKVAMEIQEPMWEEVEDSPEMFKRSKLIKDIEEETLQKCPWCGVPNAYSKKQKKCFECGKTLEEKL